MSPLLLFRRKLEILKYPTQENRGKIVYALLHHTKLCVSVSLSDYSVELYRFMCTSSSCMYSMQCHTQDCLIPIVYVTGSDKRVNFTHFPILFLIIKNSKTTAAIGMKLGMNILPSSCYTLGILSPPISCVGGVSANVDRVQNCCFMPHFGGLPLETGGLLTYLWSRRPKLFTN